MAELTDATPELRAHHEQSLAFVQRMLAGLGHLSSDQKLKLAQFAAFDQDALAKIDAGTLKATKDG